MFLARGLLFLVLLSFSAGQSFGQDTQPLSAIDWLSDSVALPILDDVPTESPTANSATAPSVTVTSLDDPSPDRIGLLSPDVTGLPATLWSGSDAPTLVAQIARLPRVDIPALQEFSTILMLAKADAPLGSTENGAVFLARIDALLAMGRLDEALALLIAADPNTPQMFQRYFDVALLKGTETEGCTLLESRPSVAPTVTSRIFCLARSGDWNAAALTLNTNRLLGDMSDEDVFLLTLFLDAEQAEDVTNLPQPSRITPLVFRIREAIGERLSTTSLPLAFAHADLQATTGWKTQLDAAERLSRAGSLDAQDMQALYLSGTPSASGGVWDRVDAFQRFDIAISRKDAAAVANALPPVWDAMKAIRAEVGFAQLYGADLRSVDLPPEAAAIATQVALLSPEYELTTQAADPFLRALAQGRPQEVETSDPLRRAVQSAFNGSTPPQDLVDLAQNGRFGLALLTVMSVLERGISGDHPALTQGLAFLRHVGLEDLARRTALQILLLERQR